MKKVASIAMVILALNISNAQQLNEKGLYVDSDGESANGVITQTHEGVKSQLNVREGVPEGVANYYYASGNLMETGTFIKGEKDQKWTRYNEAGKITAVAFYKLGKKAGTWLVFDDGGKKRFEMKYSEGQKSGVWTSWDENGAVIEEKDYSKLN